MGIYVVRRSFHLRTPILERSLLEKAEGLDLFRIFEHVTKKRVCLTERETRGMDTQEDLAEARRR